MCDSTDISILGRQYLNCEFDGLSLSFIGHFVPNSGYGSIGLCQWRMPVKWGGLSVTVSAM
jgi:hypothetical protein